MRFCFQSLALHDKEAVHQRLFRRERNVMTITSKQRSFLRGRAHPLQPVVMIGKDGLSEALLQSLETALKHHELVKIKVPADDQESFRATVDEVLSAVDCEKIQTIGHLLVVFRASSPPGKVSKALVAARLSQKRSKLSPAAVPTPSDESHDSVAEEE